jgi:hypothetical protein|tara:strand:+ start:342 stop:617 length:276 start_codon:yes stop_codon:yes gene_type:complete
MKGNEKDWWDSSPEEDEWVWFEEGDEEDRPKKSLKLKTYAVQFHQTDKITSVEIDGVSERDAIKQLTEEFGVEKLEGLFKIISVIEVDYDE